MVDFGVMVVVRIWVWCGTLASVYLPSLAVHRIYRERSVGTTPIDPILSTLANSHVWSLYGFLDRAWFPNFPAFVIGDIASLCYLFVYWRYAEDRRRVGSIIAVVLALLGVPTLFVILGLSGYTGQTREDVWRTHGLCFCDVTVISINVLVLNNLIRACKQRSAASINVLNLCVGTFYSFGWLTFGQLTSNWIIAGPQVFVLALHFSAWTMHIVFTRETSSATASITTDDDPVVLSIEFSPRPSKSFPVYEALQSPLAPLR
ncbi:MtN3-like protein [Phytophthora cinnamomi]|uniref:MtN3-like protein n=1 Tax=Phytophthora cinnamomi TaxID=4785 RepID=UPI00355A6F36|nr:MtN3-like protein [Phytophthora cinnamomi]